MGSGEQKKFLKNQTKWRLFLYFFSFLAGLPRSPKLRACSLDPLKYLPVLPSSLKINSHSPQIPKTPGGPLYSRAYSSLKASVHQINLSVTDNKFDMFGVDHIYFGVGCLWPVIQYRSLNV